MVKVPPGIKDGQRIRLSGLGTEGRGGGEAGAFYLEVNSSPHAAKDKRLFRWK